MKLDKLFAPAADQSTGSGATHRRRWFLSQLIPKSMQAIADSLPVVSGNRSVA